MRILVTGATGLLGKHLIEKLKSDDHEVLAVSRKLGVDLLNKEQISWRINAFKPEIVFHLAANCAQSRGQAAPQDMTQNNINIFLNTLIPSINAGVKRFIFTSSVAVYGDCEVPYREDDTPKPKDIYGINKLAAEQMLKVLAKVNNFEYTIFRPHNLYGPYQDMSNPYKNVVALFMRNIMEGKECTIYGEGKMRRAFSYVDDVVKVLASSMDDDTFKNQTLNVGSDLDIDLLSLLGIIERIAGKKALVKHLPARPQEIYEFLPSHKKLSLLRNYMETPLETGLRKTWEAINLPELAPQYDEIHTW